MRETLQRVDAVKVVHGRGLGAVNAAVWLLLFTNTTKIMIGDPVLLQQAATVTSEEAF